MLVLVLVFLTPTVAMSAPSLAPFYIAASKIAPNEKLGEVVKKEKVATEVPGAQAWRIAYISSDVNDKKTISTGLLVAPIGLPPKEGRPIVSWSHGTTGSAQNCGPSQQFNPAVDLNQYYLPNGNSWTDYGILSLTALIKEGYVVVATDYQGLGGGGRHQYIVGQTQGRDAINAFRAAGSMRETGAGKKALLYGWSEGGYSVLSAGSSQDYLAKIGTAYDGIDLVGVVALSPVNFSGLAQFAIKSNAGNSDKAIAEISEPLSKDIFMWGHLAGIMYGLQAAYPEKLRLTDWFTSEGAQVFDQLANNKCFHVMSDSLTYSYGDSYQSLARKSPANTAAWIDAMIAGGIPGNAPIAPVLMFRGTKDAVPKSMVDMYTVGMCKLGANVRHIELDGATHFTSPVEAQETFLSWVKERFAGKQLPNACLKN
ncbi:alpha/beta fold hydrolase [Polynucleobacter sp. CS-Odin-A6]|nr:alpha/beta fold hydrolase [Polynucleobacter sp. CS-Odin-A6]